MNVAAMRSPLPGSYEQPKRSFAPQHQHQPPQNLSRGLGLYPCAMPPLHPSGLGELTQSPQSEWSQSSMLDGDFVAPAHPPDIFSAAFDPFSGFPAAAGHGHLAGSHSPTEAPGLEFCQTPPSSIVNSHRSSVSSYAASDGSECAYTPRGKAEEAGEWYPSASNEHVLERSMSTAQALAYAPGPQALSSHPEDLYRAPPADWPKPDGPAAAYLADLQPILPSLTRTKKKRQRTTPEEATHECRVCGKLFKRSYNWKSHLETHNPERKYPHPCTALVGSSPCSKKFQRKTDLDRHHDSVHLKARNHRCGLCGNRFARRDTLRRHTEDGCPKRFELGIHDDPAGAPAPAFLQQQPPPPPPQQQQQQQPPAGSFPSPAHLAPHSASFSGPSTSGRWTFPPPAPAGFPRGRSYSVALPLGGSSMAPPPQFTRPDYAGGFQP